MRQKGFVEIMVLVVVLLLLAGVVLLYLSPLNKTTNDILSIPTPTETQFKETTDSGKECGYEGSFLSSSKVVNGMCIFWAEYTHEFEFSFPADWKFDIVSANVDNVKLHQGEFDIFVGVVGWADKNSDSMDDAYWQDTGSDAIKYYVIPRDETALSRIELIIGSHDITKLTYNESTVYLMFDFPDDEYKNVFKVSVDSTDSEALTIVEKIISSIRFARSSP